MLNPPRWAQSDAAAWLLLRGSATFLTLYGAGSCISFAVHILVARTIGATSYGYFAYATSWMAILLVLCTVGMKPTVLRFSAAYLARRHWPALEGLLREATRWTAAASVAVVLASGLLGLALRPRLDELGQTLLLVTLALPFMALSEVWSAALRGLGAVSKSQLPSSIVQHLLFGAGMLVILGIAGPGGGAAAAAAAFLAATIGSMIVAGVLLQAHWPATRPVAAPVHARREWAGVAGNNLLIALLQATRAPLIVVIAGAQVGPQHLAYYVAASRLANVITLGLTGISGFVSPRIAHHFALSEQAELQRLAHLAARGALACAMVVALALAVWGRSLLDLFGPGFGSAFLPLMVLVAGELIAAASGPVGFFLTMTGRQRTATWIEAASSALAIVLALLLIPRHGMLGVAWVVAGTGALRNAAMVIAVSRQLGLRSAVV